MNKKRLLTLMGGSKFRYEFDFSTLTDGALPSPFVGSTWEISSGVAINTPVLEDDVIVNGGFATDTDWTKGTGWTIAGDGSPAVKSPGTQSQLYQATLTTNRFYKATATFVRNAGTFYLMFGSSAYQSAITASGTISATMWASSTRAAIWGGDAAADGSVDTVSYLPITLSTTSALIKSNRAGGQVKAAFTLPERMCAGVWLCVDNPADIKNGVLAMISEGRSIRLHKLVNGVFTLLVNAGSYTDGQSLEIRRAVGTDVFQMFCNNVQIGTDQTITGMTGVYHGLFSTDPSITFSSFFIVA